MPGEAIGQKLAAVFCAVIGAAVIVGWFLDLRTVVQVLPALVPMQFNTALGILLSAVAIFGLSTGRRRLALATAALTVLIAALTLAEYAGIAVPGLDRLFVEPTITTLSPYPGRMAVNTAISFLFLAGAVLCKLLAVPLSNPLVLFGAPAAFLGALSLVGYAMAIPPGYFWFGTAMALHTAVCFTLLGGALVLEGTRDNPTLRLRLLFVAVGLLCLFALSVTYRELLAIETFSPADHAAIEARLPRVVLLASLVVLALMMLLGHVALSAAKTARALAVSQSRLNTIIHTMPDGLVIIDPQGTIVRMNPAGERIFGYAATECVGRSIAMLMPEEMAQRHGNFLAGYRRGRPSPVIGRDRQVLGRRRDGTLFPLELSVADVWVGDQLIFTGIVRDVSEREAHRLALEAANRELEELTYRTSHDLRAPVASALGLVDIARQATSVGDTALAGEAIARMQAGFARLERLIDGIQQMARVRRAREDKQAVDMAAAVGEALASLANMPNFDRLDIRVDLPAPQGVVTLPSRVGVVLQNLISNAIKYADLDKPAPYVAIGGRIDGDRYVFTVEDNGIGIPPEKSDRLFGMFERFHPRRSAGCGLGLYILRNAVETVGGSVSYTPLPEGSRFTVEMPVGDAG